LLADLGDLVLDSPENDIDDFRFHFDSMYLGGIPRLLDESGAFLAFLCVVTAIDTLAGTWAPALGSGERFKGFVQTFFPIGLRERSGELWRFRNLMVHAFNPGAFALVCHQSRLHLSRQGEVMILNAEDFYAALLIGSAEYFLQLKNDAKLAENFRRRMADTDGGAPQQFTVVRGG